MSDNELLRNWVQRSRLGWDLNFRGGSEPPDDEIKQAIEDLVDRQIRPWRERMVDRSRMHEECAALNLRSRSVFVYEFDGRSWTVWAKPEICSPDDQLKAIHQRQDVVYRQR